MFSAQSKDHYLVHDISFVYVFKNVAFLYHIVKICVCEEIKHFAT